MIPIAKPVIGEREKELVNEVLESGILAQGPKVKALEEQFAQLCGTKHAIAVTSGTAAIHAALYAAGVGPGDEVITVPFTFVATANPILMQGADIVFCDIKEDTFNIDPESVRKKVTGKTKAIIAVDLYGQPCDYDALRGIAEEHGLVIIEDACQAVNAYAGDVKAGALGDLGCFSLYATKNMMSGEGGIITTDDDQYAELCRRFRHHGQSEQTRYQYYDLGYNYRMTDLQAAVALGQLEKVDSFTNRRIENAKALNEGLSDVTGLVLPVEKEGHTHVYHQYTIRVTDEFPLTRDELLAHLKERGVGAGVYYPKPLHLHPHFSRMGYAEGAFPVAEKASKDVISLPVHPQVTPEDINTIIQVVKEAVQ